MYYINVKFQAYIPKSLGKSLLSYFQSDPRFNRESMINYDEFKRNLANVDSHDYSWLPEPGNFVSNYYFGTDNKNFHNSHSEHTVRLGLNMNVEIAKIGNLSLFDEAAIFGNSKQHSDQSHRVEAYIQKVPLYYGGSKTGVVPIDMKYEGICSKVMKERSDEKPLTKNIRNTFSGRYFSAQGSRAKEDTTVIFASASAEYPFLSWVAPQIDFKITAKFYFDGNSVLVSIDGVHNDYPAYELLIDNEVVYNYDPTKYGYDGPTPNNLILRSTYFNATKGIRLNNIKSIQDSKKRSLANAFGNRF